MHCLIWSRQLEWCAAGQIAADLAGLHIGTCLVTLHTGGLNMSDIRATCVTLTVTD